jgi:hypothetical protein
MLTTRPPKPSSFNVTVPELYGHGGLHVWGKGDARKVLRWGNLRERGHFGDVGIDGRIILTWILNTIGRGAWAGLIGLRTGTSDGLLGAR